MELSYKHYIEKGVNSIILLKTSKAGQGSTKRTSFFYNTSSWEICLRMRQISLCERVEMA